MNKKELGIYTALTHPTAPEDYRITDGGTRIYTMVDGGLSYFDGVDLDKMSPIELYRWTQEKIQELRESRLW